MEDFFSAVRTRRKPQTTPRRPRSRLRRLLRRSRLIGRRLRGTGPQGGRRLLWRRRHRSRPRRRSAGGKRNFFDGRRGKTEGIGMGWFQSQNLRYTIFFLGKNAKIYFFWKFWIFYQKIIRDLKKPVSYIIHSAALKFIFENFWNHEKKVQDI